MKHPILSLAIVASVLLGASALPIEQANTNNTKQPTPSDTSDYGKLTEKHVEKPYHPLVYPGSSEYYGQGLKGDKKQEKGGVIAREDYGDHGISAWSSDAKPNGGKQGKGGITGREDNGHYGISSWSSDAYLNNGYLVKRGVTDREDYGDHGISSWSSDTEPNDGHLIKRGVTDREDYGDHGISSWSSDTEPQSEYLVKRTEKRNTHEKYDDGSYRPWNYHGWQGHAKW
ncbi:MAG: hypothetical protein DHS80DRAFT_30798 [Piptocephalis tieghemiana]|nr:MAG: hypothetical protein DHS80DRAFT_30798 [Piptocephalis tieghemiana]